MVHAASPAGRWERLLGAWLQAAAALFAGWHQELDSAMAVRRWERLQGAWLQVAAAMVAGWHQELVPAKLEPKQTTQPQITQP